MAHRRRSAERMDKHGNQNAPHFRKAPETLTKGKTDDFDFAWARSCRIGMSVKPIDGSIIDWDDRDLDAKTIADSVEMLNPLIRPYGCGPVAPQENFVLRTYDRIIEIRNECRYDKRGLAVGDRTFKRAYQQAMRDIARYNRAEKSLRDKADAAEYAGVPYRFERDGRNNIHLDKDKCPVLVAADGDKHDVDGVLRSPAMAVRKAFEYVQDKHWHRYLFPFGCFFYHDPKKTEPGWKEWMADMVPCKTGDLCINPYSVTAADVLYLCNTVGYLERFVFVLGVILWAKEYGCNLLRYERRSGTDNEFRMFVTLERHMHLFGSIHMHRRVLETSKNDVGGNWSEMLELLDRLETKCGQEFGVQKNSLASHFDNMIVHKMKGQTGTIQSAFPKAGRISDRTR
jgi:hypothetical protein